LGNFIIPSHNTPLKNNIFFDTHLSNLNIKCSPWRNDIKIKCEKRCFTFNHNIHNLKWKSIYIYIFCVKLQYIQSPFIYIYLSCNYNLDQSFKILHENEKETTKNHIVNQLKPRGIYKKRFYTKNKSLKINKYLIEDYYYFEHSHYKT